MWVKFKADWTQKGVNGTQDTVFKKDTVVEIKDENEAKSLIKYGLAEEVDTPKEDIDLEKITKSLGETVEKIIGSSIEKALGNVENKLSKGIPIVVKEPEIEGIFHNEEHFLKSVLHASRCQKTGIAFDTAIWGEKAKNYLILGKAGSPSGQNVSHDAEGGFMVPEVMANKIWDNMESDPESILPRTDRFETSGNSLKVPAMFESSRKTGTGKRFAGIDVVWLDEAEQITATKATVSRRTLEVHKVGAVVYFTEEQLDDAAPVFNRRVLTLVPRAINHAVTEAFINGSGVGKPKGILREDSLIKIPLEAGQGDHTIFHKNVNKMYWRNWNRSNAIWMCHPDCASKLEFMYFDDDTTNKRPVYLPANLTNTPFATLYGRPILVYEYMPDFGSVGDIAFVDWSQYATLTKVGGGVKTATSIHVRFLFEEVAFRFTFRIDGRSFWTSPKEDLNGDTTRSPFVVLASRTGGSTSSGL